MNDTDKELRFMAKHYGQLVGRKIVEVTVDRSCFSDPLYGLELDDGSSAYILCDPEGNGPGFLDITK